MAAITPTSARRSTPDQGVVELWLETAATADTDDTLAVTLADHGISTLLAVEGFVHTTEGSVIVGEAPTTAVSSGVLTITVGGSTVNDKKRVYKVVGR